MRFLRASLVLAVLTALCAVPALATPTRTHKSAAHAHSSAPHTAKSGSSASTKSSSSASTKSSGKSKSKKTSVRGGKKQRGQQSIQPERAAEIQQALIRTHYLDGEPSGQWDAATVSAMQRLQADHNWQTKLTPDARALKLLGLGPDYSTAINAQGASFAAPAVAPTTNAEQAAGFAAGAGINR